MPSPTCTVNGSNTTNGVNVSGSSTVTIQLTDLTGVNTWSISCISTDDKHVPATITASLSINNITKTATFTSPTDDGNGTALIFQSQVNSGHDVNGQVNDSFTTTFGVFILAASGYRVTAPNQTVEGDATNGWSKDINAMLRVAGAAVGLATSSTAGTVKMTGDFGGGGNSPTVVGLTGTSHVINIHGDGNTATLTFDTGLAGVTLNQADKTNNNTSGQTLTIQAQNETGTTSTGGNLTLTSGTGTSVAGNILLQTGGTTKITVAPALITMGSVAGNNKLVGGLIQTTFTANSGVDRTVDASNTNDNIIIVNTLGGSVNVNLPVPTNGRTLVVIDKNATSNGNSVTLVRNGSEKINGVAASLSLSQNPQNVARTIWCDGTDWYVSK